MEKFTSLTSSAVPLKAENVDTDQIIPARFLKAVSREGFGENLFHDWRYDDKKNPKKDFVLNDSRFKGKILIAGKNFGCGSSREHAAWALYDFGFRAVASSFFADIFRNNALNNGLLPVQVSESFLTELFTVLDKNNSQALTINLQNQIISIDGTAGREKFDINAFRKTCLLNGFDTVDFLLSKKKDIEEYEKKRNITLL